MQTSFMLRWISAAQEICDDSRRGAKCDGKGEKENSDAMNTDYGTPVRFYSLNRVNDSLVCFYFCLQISKLTFSTFSDFLRFYNSNPSFIFFTFSALLPFDREIRQRNYNEELKQVLLELQPADSTHPLIPKEKPPEKPKHATKSATSSVDFDPLSGGPVFGADPLTFGLKMAAGFDAEEEEDEPIVCF
jgi:hypothetical protein